MYHTPVLIEQSLDCLSLKPGGRVIDATLGDGGHSERILQAIGPTGHLLALDASPTSIERARARLAKYAGQLTIVHANFAEMAEVATAHHVAAVDGILFDLGIASWQLGLDGASQLDPPSPVRLRRGQGISGLSFSAEESLDMRLDPRRTITAAKLINRATPETLTDLFERYGDVHRARPLVDRIVAARKQKAIETTSDFVQLVGTKSPKALAPLFQALRIAVNEELTVLPQALDAALSLLRAGGRLVVLSYHSGEDRIVKQALRSAAAAGKVTILTNHPMQPTDDEQRQNPRSRSAKLRAVEVK